MADADPHPVLKLVGTDGGFTPPPVAGLSGAAWQLDPHAFGLVRLAGDEVDVVLRGEADAWT